MRASLAAQAYFVLTVMPSVPAEITAKDMSRKSPCSTTPTVSSILQKKSRRKEKGVGEKTVVVKWMRYNWGVETGNCTRQGRGGLQPPFGDRPSLCDALEELAEIWLLLTATG